VRAAYDKAALGDVIQSAFDRNAVTGGDLDLSKKHDRDLNITIECDAEYMCIESRVKFLDTETPVTQKQYDAVRDYCGGRYGCIEAFFREWPRDIPAKVTKDAAASPSVSGLSFSSLLNKQQPASASPAGSQTTGVEASEIKLVTASKPSEDLLASNRKIRQKCGCSLSGQACFDNPYGPIRNQLAQIEQQRATVCQSWQAAYGSMTSATPVERELAVTDLERVEGAMDQIDRRGLKIIDMARKDFEYIQWLVSKGRSGPLREYLPEVNRIANDWTPVTISGRVNLPGANAGTGTATSSTAEQTRTQNAIVQGPLLDWAGAKAYCQSRGMQLPTLAMAAARRSDLQSGDPWYGVWTSDQTGTDRLGRQARTFRSNNGDNQGAPVAEKHRTFCFPG
jgi:hypothetical protein